MLRIAIFPGSFDPITRGHENIVKRALPLFDKIIIAIGNNQDKKNHFSVEERIGFIEKVFADYPLVSIDTYQGLTVNYCREVGAQYILRGLRTSADFEFERSIAQVNKKMYPAIETVFMLTLPEYTAINSSVVRDILRHGGDPSLFIPDGLSLTRQPGLS
ncbi:MAG: pantetheine-phosphate adenylyltransferase [Bacteroidales bacterium]|jgi:pantetheine-phosphate adenylyltransferase|nr:pantetheine-phosphate adenylyltransferase [Bacteroidales bacterium]NCU35288.1 pantetheine-phosphate adenylyltransferase [Candidatus Falkowbacteria bacterium]MDD2630896.1 pantetheine-phosphate adenylyltransferase [Bacteroidales bacterium]MDD3527294.1 pantetheine-phosphate adenylyltransferase [Bacteroidales bacterium]MDD4176596.1 pantetheine-phosphate adenylyltransferase [Bacteroidales bacterium]